MTGRIRAALASLLCCFCLVAPARADDTLAPFAGRNWFAVSTTAMGITDDVRIVGDTIAFGKWAKFRLRYVGEVDPETADSPAGGPPFKLYEIVDPRPVKLRSGTPFCGPSGDAKAVPAKYIAMGIIKVVGSDYLELAVYSDRPTAKGKIDRTFCSSFGYGVD